MTEDLYLRRKLTLRAHDEQVVFVKRKNERTEHVLMKAFIWALYLPRYPDLVVEIKIGDRYKPDVVALDRRNRPRFWGEAGQIGRDKIRSLATRFRDTHFAIAKWDTNLAPLREIVSGAVEGLKRSAPFDLLNVPPDSGKRYINAKGKITVSFDDMAEFVRISPEPPAHLEQPYWKP